MRRLTLAGAVLRILLLPNTASTPAPISGTVSDESGAHRVA